MSPKYLQNIWTNPYLNKKHKDRQPLPETLLWFCRNCFPEDKWQYLRFCDFPVHLPRWKNLRSAHLENYRNLQILENVAEPCSTVPPFEYKGMLSSSRYTLALPGVRPEL